MQPKWSHLAPDLNVNCEQASQCKTKIHTMKPLSQQTNRSKWLLPPDAVRWRGIRYGDVAVCVSVTLMYYAQTTEYITMLPSEDFSPAILVFPHQIWTQQLERTGYSTHWGDQMRGVGKSRKIRPINRSQSPEDSYWQHSMESCASWRFVSRS